MDTQQVINLIKESFESWYNKVYPSDFPVSIVINYSDRQTLSIKAYHTVSVEVSTLTIKDGAPVVTSLIKLEENYNHGLITEEEAKLDLTKKVLEEMFSYQTSML